MNYRHLYHAGNFADVFKHIVLVALTQSFLRKPNGFCYLDTHAGAGLYDLISNPVQINKEYENGIAKILTASNPPELIQDYLSCLPVSDKNHLWYPGSPSFVKPWVRNQDRMILSELHPEEFAVLKKLFSHNKQIAIHHQDGYQSLKAFLPPKEKRGFVLIDPPYEKQGEFDHLTEALIKALKRWESGTFAIWYPIKITNEYKLFLSQIKQTIHHPMLITELSIYPETYPQLKGSGMLIINPPWQLDIKLKEVLPWLWHCLSQYKHGSYQINTFP